MNSILLKTADIEIAFVYVSEFKFVYEGKKLKAGFYDPKIIQQKEEGNTVLVKNEMGLPAMKLNGNELSN